MVAAIAGAVAKDRPRHSRIAETQAMMQVVNGAAESAGHVQAFAVQPAPLAYRVGLKLPLVVMEIMHTLTAAVLGRQIGLEVGAVSHWSKQFIKIYFFTGHNWVGA
ncbi:MAG: hypothetical protein K8963_02685 [Proteobacteria bacterium]|nr:hypothetical protein [Pseudomonadota bacterium]